MSDLKSKIESYQKALDKYGVSVKALQWGSEEAAIKRYEQIVADIDFSGKSVYDGGCGFGDIIPFIEAKSKNFNYLGVDAVSEFIEIAKKKYPRYEFICGDFLDFRKKTYDIVMTSGTLNAAGDNPLEYRKSAIKVMFEHANYALVFNMAGGHPKPASKEGGRVYYADSMEILKYCLILTPKVIFRHHYHERDYTVVMIK